MENLAQLVPLIILAPAIGAFINFFWGARIGEQASAIVGTTASAFTFIIAVLLLVYLVNNDNIAAVVNPPILDTSWIRMDSINVDITWQTRVDTLSVTMMLFVTFVGTLIHLYSYGYMHGDPRFSRFFAYLNLFLTFMLILVTGNNLLMMFVGWEGVGLCSYLLIGFWWDKPDGEGWSNSNAARKAFIANRIGDFGVLMAVFFTFWTFGTLDFYKPFESANPEVGYAYAEEEAFAPGMTVLIVEETGGAAEEESSTAAATYSYQDPEIEMSQLGIFGQAERMVEAEADVNIGPLNLSIEAVLVIITLFMLLGATGKSAQIPLFVWLPDAMAGPTPVSALIHAATMVTAGVYMMVRSNTFFYNAEFTSFIVTLVGVGTALVAGFIAVGQFDIKRVLAYSTVSQLGFMVAAVGIGAYPAAMFHMMTHAFFKALLFLGSGSVIHGVEHGHHEVAHGHASGSTVEHEDVHGYAEDTEGDHRPATTDEHDQHAFDPQDMRNMGGLKDKMPITYWTYIFGTLALAGIWPFAGFWSKDEILADSWLVGIEDGELAGFIALGGLLIAAGFTAFYMWRQVEMVFHGKPRTEAAEHAHESPWTMTVPLRVLAVGSVLVGFFNLPSGTFSRIFAVGLDGVFGKHAMADFLEYSILHYHIPDFQAGIALGALAIGLGGIFLAHSMYGDNKAINAEGKDPLETDPNTGMVFGFANARLYWDELYDTLFIRPYGRVAKFLSDVIDWNFWHDYFHDKVIGRGYRSMGQLFANPVDLGLIDGLVNGVGWVVQRISGGFSRIQTGYVRTYAVALFLGVVAVVVLILLPLI
jgi:NADH-quinone oxidoreductase subunit L